MPRGAVVKPSAKRGRPKMAAASAIDSLHSACDRHGDSPSPL